MKARIIADFRGDCPTENKDGVGLPHRDTAPGYRTASEIQAPRLPTVERSPGEEFDPVLCGEHSFDCFCDLYWLRAVVTAWSPN